VAHEQAPPALIQLLQAFNNPFIYVLMALAAVSFVTDYWLPLRNGEETDLTGIIIIVTMVSLSGLLRFWQEFRTNKAAQALKSMVRTTATVLRRGPGIWGRCRRRLPLRSWCPVTSSSWRRGSGSGGRPFAGVPGPVCQSVDTQRRVATG
jgi:Mg2+-importing ATPase